MRANHKSPIDELKVCPKCGYNCNPKEATSCILCNTTLVTKDKTQLLKSRSSAKPTKSTKPTKPTKSSGVELIFKNKTKNWLNFRRKSSNIQLYRELQKPINLLGLFVVGFALIFWSHYLFVIRPNSKAVVSSPEEKVKAAVNTNPVPEGLFSYGGASIFAPLVKSGINANIEDQNPGFELRYTKPLNQDFSSENGIEMLINGELSFAFNDRALSDSEFRKANLRRINLKQVPMAIDGVVLFGNDKLKTSKLNLEQVRKIFTGEIKNWNQVSPHAPNLPITPIVVRNEGFTVLNVEPNSVTGSTKYTDNYTQALRKVIATPGSISFASASLVQNQQLIKTFELAEGNSTNYISPMVNGKLNLEAFKSGSYPLTRRVFLVFREDNTLDEKAGIAYSKYVNSPGGQKIVFKSGFVPLY